MRVGMRHFWTAGAGPAPRLRIAETLPIAALLAAAVWMVAQGESVLAYARATADTLHRPALYIGAVMRAQPVQRLPAATP